MRDNATCSDGILAADGNPDESQLLHWNRDVAMLGISVSGKTIPGKKSAAQPRTWDALIKSFVCFCVQIVQVYISYECILRSRRYAYLLSLSSSSRMGSSRV